MTSDTAVSASVETAVTSRGRPRSTDRTDAILDATNELCREVGYDGLRMQDVADRAGTGLATIYRRWSTKPELVAAAIGCRPIIELEPTDDPVQDLRTIVSSLATDIGTGDMVAGFISAIREHEELRVALTESLVGRVRPLLCEVITRVAPNAPSVDFIADGIAGTLLVRTTMLDDIRDPDQYANEVLELVLALR